MSKKKDKESWSKGENYSRDFMIPMSRKNFDYFIWNPHLDILSIQLLFLTE